MRNVNAKVPDLEKIETCPGDRYHQLYKSKVRHDGVIELIPDGTEDIWQKINAEVEKTDMAYILRQMQLGDMSAFTRMPNYADISEFPTNYQEVLQVMIDRERDFYAMPLDVREKFNNNFYYWLATLGTEEWFETMGISDQKEPSASEEKEDE